MPKADGGRAFPNPQQVNELGNIIVYAELGMTLRQYYAGLFLQGLLACPLDPVSVREGNPLPTQRAHRRALVALMHADALIEEEAKHG